jgi:hypothetical protein
VHDFTFVTTGSELAAALLEARAIRDERPPHNRNRRHLPRLGFLKLNPRSHVPRLAATHRLGTDRGLYVGPFPNLHQARQAQKALARVFGLHTRVGDPLPNDVSQYRERVEVFRAFVEGDGSFHAGELPPDDRAALDDVVQRRRTIGAVLTRQNFVVLLPTVERDAAQLYVVLGGRLAFESRIGADSDFLAAIRVIRERYDAFQNVPLGRADVEATTVLAGWLRDRKREGLLMRLDGPTDFERRLDELVVTLHDLRQRGPLPAIDGLA